MTLKAAYFSFTGLADTDTITWKSHLLPAIDRGRKMQIAWSNRGAGHDVRAWAELLVLSRAGSQSTSYPAPFARDIQYRGQRISAMWRETLRYHKNVAYLYEVRQVQEAVEWLLANSTLL